MKAIVNTKPGGLELKEWPTPDPGPGQVRIKTAACGVCATDLEMISGWKRTGFPSIPGHEWSGIVDAVGRGVDPDWAGRHCVGENILPDGGEVGFEYPGGYGEYLITEAANLHFLPEDFPLYVAALIEPLAVCVRGFGRLRLHNKSLVLIFGDGPIGLLMAMLLRFRGVEKIFIIGGRKSRLTLARELGVDEVLNRHRAKGGLCSAIRGVLGAAFPNIVEASGAPEALEASLELVAREGKILVLGDYRESRAEFLWNALIHREVELIGSNASAGAWPEAVWLAEKNAIPLHRLISHRFPASQYKKAIATARSGRKAVKVVLDWQE